MSEANFLAALKKMDVDAITQKQTAATKSRFLMRNSFGGTDNRVF